MSGFCCYIYSSKSGDFAERELEQIRLIQQLEEEDKQTIFRLVEKMLTNKKFKDFFAKNAAAL